ncbi:uncharacterized protein BYT42DRAFT_584481 [Radiomyces spectabilis]|uniref:uncharacterized protein n=1 Tax=Radiomyces spectabilis TaxID=64574 RepID=UPI00221F69EA|nr:uncharacterized protein BYT42DRAFT_584481 [Radiomyces spectabilis]KAI8369438.1 hypothetical protein BYT42DRAFT_584481 [Radiomyces spectabilis]
MPTPAPPVPASYYENFLEILAQIVSKLLTDKETEAVVASLRSFQDRLKRLSSQSFSRLRLELSIAEKDHAPFCHHAGKTCIQNSLRGFIKAFSVAFTVKYLIGILPALLTGKLLKRPRILKQMAGRDTMCFALFLSTFLSSYKAILCAMRRWRKNPDPSSDKLNAFVAGSVAGIALILDRDKRRRQSIMLYLLTRSFQFSGAWLMKQWGLQRQTRRRKELAILKEKVDREGQPRELEVGKKWDDYLAKFIQRWAGVLVMMLANGQIIYSFLLNSETLPRSYFTFLLTHAGWKSDVGGLAEPLADVIGNNIRFLSETRGSIRLPKDTTSYQYIADHVSPNIASVIPAKLRHKYIMCALQHPLEDSCSRSAFRSFKLEYLRALKLYVPLNLIMMGVFRSGQLTSNPNLVLRKFAISCLRSGLFLTMYVTMGLGSACTFRRIFEKERHWMYVLVGVVGGSMTLFEARGRQLELGLYCLPRAMEAFWKTMEKQGRIRNVRHGEIWLFMASMGVLMTLYQNEKDTISPHYLSVMTRFFGHN